MVTLVSPLCAAFAGEHSDWKLILSPEREDPSGEGKGARDVLLAYPQKFLAPVLRCGEGHPRHPSTRNCLMSRLYRDFLSSNRVTCLSGSVGVCYGFEILQSPPCRFGQGFAYLLRLLQQGSLIAPIFRGVEECSHGF